MNLARNVRKCNMELQDTVLLAIKLAAGDKISQNAVYHRACLVALYNRAIARAKNIDKDKNQSQQRIEGIAFAELIAHMKDTHIESDAASVFRLAKLARLYKTRLKLFGCDISGRFYNTHLKSRIVAHQQDLQAYREGNDALLAFNKDVGAALRQAYERDFDDEAWILSQAAKIVRRDMFSTSFRSHLKIIVSEKAPLNL